MKSAQQYTDGTTLVIKTDLEYVAHNWKYECFDLWEEVHAYHFFTLMVQRKALLDGARFAQYMKDDGAADYYAEVARTIGQVILDFYDTARNFVVVTREWITVRQENWELKYKSCHRALISNSCQRAADRRCCPPGCPPCWQRRRILYAGKRKSKHDIVSV